MQNFSRLALAAAAITLISLPATIAPAENAPIAGTKPTTTPAATTATTAPVEAKPATTTEQKKRGPVRHRKSVHKDYLHFVPFDQMW